MTESAFRRREVALSSLGIYYYEVVSPGSAGENIGRFSGVPRVPFTWGNAAFSKRLHGGKQGGTWGNAAFS